MKFFSRENCDKLKKLGCVSELGFVWSVYETPICIIDPTYVVYHDEDNTPAFIEQDFTGSSNQAKENAKKRWGDKHIGGTDRHVYPTAYEWHRHAMIDAPDAEAYLMERL